MNGRKFNQKKMLAALVVLLILVAVVGSSYALWQLVISQTEKNVVTSGCFKVTYEDGGTPLTVEDASPISDTEGLTQTPYSFTITNVCDNYASYQINLETLDTTDFNSLEYIKIAFQNRSPELLSDRETIEPTLENATTSYMLEKGFLDYNESKTFTLKMWLDDSFILSEEYLNQVLDTKITVSTNYLGIEPTYDERINACTESGYQEEICQSVNSKYQTTE